MAVVYLLRVSIFVRSEDMVLGLTGNIASGKSTVANWLAEFGAVVVSADELAREVVQPGSAGLIRLVEMFGEEILADDGSLDRKHLGQIVFAKPAARRRLESVTHPAIARLAEERLNAFREEGVQLVVYEAPLLFEAGADRRVDQTLVVLVEKQVQITRIMVRDGLDEEAAKARVAAQWPQADKVMRADYVIDNSGPVEQTRLVTEALYRYLISLNRPALPSR